MFGSLQTNHVQMKSAKSSPLNDVPRRSQPSRKLPGVFQRSRPVTRHRLYPNHLLPPSQGPGRTQHQSLDLDPLCSQQRKHPSHLPTKAQCAMLRQLPALGLHWATQRAGTSHLRSLGNRSNRIWISLLQAPSFRGICSRTLARKATSLLVPNWTTMIVWMKCP